MPSYEDLQRDYWAPDREAVLADARNPQPQPQQQQQQPWDRSAFRDQWMSSGVQNVPDMQKWLQNTGWGNQVRMGGSKGDLMYLPSGEVMDTVLAAGLGGNRGGPQWTGRGNWDPNSGMGYTPYGGQQQQYGGMGPSPQMQLPYQRQTAGWGQMYGGMNQQAQQQTQMHRGFGRHQMMQNRQQQNPYGQQPRMRPYGGGMQPSGGMQSQKQPQMQQPNYSQNKGMYY
jgi:hypothetical protein